MGISQTLAVNESSYHPTDKGHSTNYKLGFGQSPFPIPPYLLSLYRESASHNEYLPVSGYQPLRQAVAKYYSERDGRPVHEDCVLIGPGSKELLYLFQLVLSQTSVYQVSPAWVSYPAQAKILHREIISLMTSAKDKWKLNQNNITPLLSDPNPHKALIMTSPNNPTGISYTSREYQWLATQLKKDSVVVVADEIYEKLQFNGTFVSLAKFYPEGTIISSGLSKSCSVGGWRLGYMVFPSQLKDLCQAMTNVASETYSCASSPAQIAAVSVFSSPELYTNYWRSCQKILKSLSSYCVKLLHSSGIDCQYPDGGWYIYPTFDRVQVNLNSHGIHTANDLARRLVRETGVATISSNNFSSKTIALRLCLVDFDGETALSNQPHKITTKWLCKYCPKVIEGIKRLCVYVQTLVEKQ